LLTSLPAAHADKKIIFTTEITENTLRRRKEQEITGYNKGLRKG
jgi:hypothetical protein